MITLNVFCKLFDAAVEAGRDGDMHTLVDVNERVKDINIRFSLDGDRLYMLEENTRVAIAWQHLPVGEMRKRRP